MLTAQSGEASMGEAFGARRGSVGASSFSLALTESMDDGPSGERAQEMM